MPVWYGAPLFSTFCYGGAFKISRYWPILEASFNQLAINSSLLNIHRPMRYVTKLSLTGVADLPIDRIWKVRRRLVLILVPVIFCHETYRRDTQIVQGENQGTNRLEHLRARSVNLQWSTLHNLCFFCVFPCRLCLILPHSNFFSIGASKFLIVHVRPK